MPPEKTLLKIKELVVPFYAQLDQWHGYDHGKRVYLLAKEINKEEGGDSFLVEAGAWLHQYHDNLDELKGVLTSLQISVSQETRLFEIVEQCRPDKISAESSLEARIVFDADALELVGPYGIFREVLCNAIARKLPPTEAISVSRYIQKLFIDNLQTNKARAMAKPANEVAEMFWREFDRWELELESLRFD